MSKSAHHQAVTTQGRGTLSAPSPEREAPEWKRSFLRAFGDDPETKWGGRFMRMSNDMMLACDENLTILYHNRSFVRGVGLQSGSYLRRSLLEFFPEEDRSDASRTLVDLMHGEAGGMRFGSTLLTVQGRRAFDLRVVRGRHATNRFHLFFVIREEMDESATAGEESIGMMSSIFTGLPVAAFRADRRLKIVGAVGRFWDRLGIETESLMGGDLTDSACVRVPSFLHEIDFCETMAGITQRTSFCYDGEACEITIEPFLDRKRRVMGVVGMIRKAKALPEKLAVARDGRVDESVRLVDEESLVALAN
ncbi:MAG: PAS domain-containing protein [Verrucomicrobiota bacterium]